MICDAIDDKEVCTSCVESIFLVVGGNDTENIRSNSGIEKLKSSFNDLICLINSNFPSIRINILSLMPRRFYSFMHVQRVGMINDFLYRMCRNNRNNCFYIKMFTKFLMYKNKYFTRNEIYLNEDLYKSDRLHFSPRGISVLAKTLIGVANNPY